MHEVDSRLCVSLTNESIQPPVTQIYRQSPENIDDDDENIV